MEESVWNVRVNASLLNKFDIMIVLKEGSTEAATAEIRIAHDFQRRR
jgi:hypothetical protein